MLFILALGYSLSGVKSPSSRVGESSKPSPQPSEATEITNLKKRLADAEMRTEQAEAQLRREKQQQTDTSQDANGALLASLQKERNELWQKLYSANSEIEGLRKQLEARPRSSTSDSTSTEKPKQGDAICGYCQGQGWYWGVLNGPQGNQNATKCQVCGGKGRVPVDSPYAGTTKDGKRKCQMCLGAGKVSLNGVQTACEYCGGSGLIGR